MTKKKTKVKKLSLRKRLAKAWDKSFFVRKDQEDAEPYLLRSHECAHFEDILKRAGVK